MYINLNYNKNNIILNLNYYFYFIILIGIYYLTPSLQFVLFQTQHNNVQCYYNDLCNHRFKGINAFNNIVSNLFYIVFGVIFLVTVKLKKFNIDITNENNEECIDRTSNSIGVYENKSLYYSLGLCLIFEGISSGLYHLCPSKLNLQFDTTFMFIGLALTFLILYHKRNIGELCSPVKFFSILYLIIILNILSLIENKNTTHFWIWLVAFIVAFYCILCLTLHVYFNVSNDIDFTEAWVLLKKVDYRNLMSTPKFWIITILNVFTLVVCVYAGLGNIYFTHWILFLEIFNLIIYFGYYLIQKILNREKINIIIQFSLIINTILSVAALYFFFKSNTNIMLSFEKSKELNDKCVLFDYFDNHDIWHILSATSLYIFMNVILYIDYDIEYNIEEIIGFF